MRVAILSMFTAFAIVLSYVESFIPIIWIYGAKLGLANLVIVLVMYIFSTGDAAIVNFLRILLVGFMFGNMFSIAYSIAGAAVSLFFMAIFKSTKKFRMVSVSVVGGVFHNIGQLVVAVFVTGTAGVLYYAPLLMIMGVITGLINGVIADAIYKRTFPFIEEKLNNKR